MIINFFKNLLNPKKEKEPDIWDNSLWIDINDKVSVGDIMEVYSQSLDKYLKKKNHGGISFLGVSHFPSNEIKNCR